MPTYLFWPLLIAAACGGFLLGVRVEGYRWRQRCKDMLIAEMETEMETELRRKLDSQPKKAEANRRRRERKR